MKCHVRTFPTIQKSPVEVFSNGINTIDRQKIVLDSLSFSSECLDHLVRIAKIWNSKLIKTVSHEIKDLQYRNGHVALQNFTTIHRAQDNSWMTNNFWPIMLYIWSL